MERRDLEVKFLGQPGETGVFEGYASLFGEPADAVGDVIAPGAFAASLAEHRAAGRAPLLLWQHDPTEPIGRWESVTEDRRGLRVRGRLVLDTARGREAYALLKAGAIDGLSIGFRTVRAERRPGGGRILRRIDLIEISLVSLPAASAARVTGVKADPSAIPAASAAQPKELPMQEDDLAPGEGVTDDRVAALAATVEDLGGRVAGLEDTVTATKATAERIETRLNRPGARIETKAAEPGEIEGKAFARFVRHGREALSADQIKSLRVSDDTAGGYMAPDRFVAELLRNLVVFSPVRSVARVAATAAGSVLLPKRTGALTASWVGETEDRPATSPTYGQVELPVHELAAYVDVSNRMLEDAAFDLEAELARDFAEEFGRAEGAAFVAGDGVKKPLGVLNASVTTVKNGHATTLQPDGVLDLFHALPTAYAANGAWGMNRSTIGAIRKLKDGDGRYLWTEPLTEGALPTILGRPVVEMPDMPDLGSGETPIIFGDFTSGYRIFDRVNLSVLRDPYTVQTSGLVRFHARRRVAAGVAKAEAFRLLKMET